MIIGHFVSTVYWATETFLKFRQAFFARSGECLDWEVYDDHRCVWSVSTAERSTPTPAEMYASTDVATAVSRCSVPNGKKTGQTILESGLSLALVWALRSVASQGPWQAELSGYSLACTVRTNHLSDDPKDCHYRRDPCDFCRIRGLRHA